MKDGNVNFTEYPKCPEYPDYADSATSYANGTPSECSYADLKKYARCCDFDEKLKSARAAYEAADAAYHKADETAIYVYMYGCNRSTVKHYDDIRDACGDYLDYAANIYNAYVAAARVARAPYEGYVDNAITTYVKGRIK